MLDTQLIIFSLLNVATLLLLSKEELQQKLQTKLRVQEGSLPYKFKSFKSCCKKEGGLLQRFRRKLIKECYMNRIKDFCQYDEIGTLPNVADTMEGGNIYEIIDGYSTTQLIFFLCTALAIRQFFNEV